MENQSEPAHNLVEIQAMVRAGAVWYRRAAVEGAAELEMTAEDIDACILGLTAADFRKSMPSTRPVWSDCVMDVYKPSFMGEDLYVKFQRWPQEKVYVVSFKRKYDDDHND